MNKGERVATTIRLWAMIVGGALLLAACGFQLQGRHDYPFKRLYVVGANPEMAGRIRRMIEGGSGDTRIVKTQADADATLTLSSNRGQNVLSLTAQGLVSEYELDETVGYTLTAADGTVLIPPSTIRVNRSMTYSDQYALAKQSESDLLFRDMDIDIVAQLLRRLALVQSLTPTQQQQVPAINPRVPLPPPNF